MPRSVHGKKNLIKVLIKKIKKESNEEALHRGLLGCRFIAAHVAVLAEHGRSHHARF